jgi:hypothetical protein
LAAAYEIRKRPQQARQRLRGLGHAWWLIGFAVLVGISIVVLVSWFSVSGSPWQTK